MTKRLSILALIWFSFFVSCASIPGDKAADTAGSGEFPVPAQAETAQAVQAENDGEAEADSGLEDAVAIEDAGAEGAGSVSAAAEESETPDFDGPEDAPGEPDPGVVLPEPAVPEPVQDTVPPEPVQDTIPSAAELPPEKPAEPVAAPVNENPIPRAAEPKQSPPEERPVQPPHIGPVEEAKPETMVREPVPVPVKPVPEAPAFQELPSDGIEEPEIVYSRVVRATVGQMVEIPFRGTGWVYLGELASRRGIAYDSRRLDPEGQSFIFRAETAGVYSLKFYKQDFIRDYILNDHVQVIVGEVPETAGSGWFNPPVDRGRVVAVPRWPAVLEEAEARGQGPGAQAARPAPGAAETSAETAAELQSGQPIADEGIDPVRPPVSMDAGRAAQEDAVIAPEAELKPPLFDDDALPAVYLQKAREEFEAGRVASAIGALDQFKEKFPSGSDEAYWLYGQYYEANSPSRDIRLSLDYYRRLIREYPQSPRYTAARRRVAYLERFYINIQ
jgi:hypothetical protein